MTRKALGIAAALVVGALISVAVAQSRRPATPAPQTPAQIATRALLEGRYDEVRGLTEQAQGDPAMVALRARADIARGRYSEAEAAASCCGALADERSRARTRTPAQDARPSRGHDAPHARG